MTGSASVKIPSNLSLCGGEIQNAKLQSLATKSNPVEADFWYDSVNHKPVYYNGSAVKDFGKEYSAGTGISLNGTTISVDTSTVALKSDITTVYKAAGTVASASDLPTLSASVLGNVYNVTTPFNTTSDFVEGSGKTIQVGNDIAVVDVGTGSSHSYKFSVMGDFIDLSSYQKANTAVTHTASTAVGSTTTPIYVASDGKATALEYTIEKSVPSDAVFTDTKNTAGSTNDSRKLFLIGTTTQVATSQTYSRSTAFVDPDGRLNSAAPATNANNTTVATTKWVKDQSYINSALGIQTTLGYAPLNLSTQFNPELTSLAGGICTWQILKPSKDTEALTLEYQITVYEIVTSGSSTTYNVVYPSISLDSVVGGTGYITITFLSTTNIPANTYVACIVY